MIAPSLISYPRQDSGRAAEAINEQLRVIEEWGAHWQVTFALEKPQAMVCSRSPAAKAAMAGKLCFGGDALPLQEEVKILGVEGDQRRTAMSKPLPRKPLKGSLL